MYLLFTRELIRQTDGTGIAINALHPGAVSTNLGKENGWIAGLAYMLIGLFFKTPEQGAASSIWLASSEEAGSFSGRYIVDCKERELKSWAKDDAAAQRLWQLSLQNTGLV